MNKTYGVQNTNSVSFSLSLTNTRSYKQTHTNTYKHRQTKYTEIHTLAFKHAQVIQGISVSKDDDIYIDFSFAQDDA